MSIENEKTIEVYEKTAIKYITNSQVHDAINPEKANLKRENLEKFLKQYLIKFQKGAKCFEIGAGDGTNANYIKNLGYNITASDTVDGFINTIKSKGLTSIKFNILKDEFPDKYSAILCWRVFVHFTKRDVENALQKVYNSLENGGIFIFNASNREEKQVDEEWIDFEGEYHMGVERYYKYFSEKELNEMINNIGYTVLDFHKEGGDSNNKWLVYVLKK